MADPADHQAAELLQVRLLLSLLFLLLLLLLLFLLYCFLLLLLPAVSLRLPLRLLDKLPD